MCECVCARECVNVCVSESEREQANASVRERRREREGKLPQIWSKRCYLLKGRVERGGGEREGVREWVHGCVCVCV